MRHYIIINAINRDLIDYSKVNQVSIDALRYSNNFEKILLSYEGDKLPRFFYDCIGQVQGLNRLDTRILMNSSSWSTPEEEIL